MAQTKCGFNDGPAGQGRQLLATYGPTLLVDIGFDTTYDPLVPGKIPIAGVTGMRALVDTGACECCIDSLLASQLNLPIADRRPISGVHSSHIANMYLAQIHIPALAFTLYGMFAGVDLAAGGQVHRALIGRTFLLGFTLIYEGRTGNVIISSD